MKTADSDNGKSKKRGQAASDPGAMATVEAPPRDAYVTLTSRPGAGATTPILFSGNRVGDAVLSTSIGRMAGSAVAGMSALLPVGLSGLEVHEPLHRFDANMHLPTLERGISSANRVGEPLGMLSLLGASLVIFGVQRVATTAPNRVEA